MQVRRETVSLASLEKIDHCAAQGYSPLALGFAGIERDGFLYEVYLRPFEP